MRRVREITAEEENFRLEVFAPGCSMGKRDPVQQESIGTIVLKAFRITGYRPDCDGSLIACLENIDMDLNSTGWEENGVGVDTADTLVITEQELKNLANQCIQPTC